MIKRPEPGEYNPYFERYISLVPEGNYFAMLAANTSDNISLFSSVSKDKEDYCYADGKWSIKKVLMHIIDTERVMQYRALCAARCDSAANLPNMEEDEYNRNTDVSARSLDDLVGEFRAVRESSVWLLKNISEEKSQFKAKAGEYLLSTRAVAYIIIGHVIHHIGIVKERYLKDN